MENVITVNGVRYVKEATIGEKPWVIVRSDRAGVFFGRLDKKEKDSVVLLDSRRLWYWSGAASLSELAKSGVKRPSECKFPVSIDRHEVFDVIEILPTTEAAKKSIDGVEIWEA